MRSGVAIGFGALMLLALGRPAGATVANDLCPPAADPCVITADRTITSDSTLDFGTRTVMVQPGRSLDVGLGAMNIRAGVLRLLPKAKLLGAGGFISVTTTGAIDIQASGSDTARIDVSDVGGGGAIDLEAGGAVTIAGELIAKGDDTEADGGDIFVSAGGDMRVTAVLNAKGGGDAGGGGITLIAGGALNVTEPMDVSAGEFDGGDIDLTATGNLVIATRADMDITGGSLSGSGGSVSLLSLEGNVSMGGRILGTSGGSAEEGGGFGGTVDAAALVGGVTFLENIDVFGGSGGGGGDGGDVTVLAGGPIIMSSNIDSRGGVDTTTLGFGDGGGGNVFLEGCDVTVTAGRTIDTRGATFGTNVLRAGGQLRVAGTLLTALSNLFEYRDPARPPVVTGTVSPPAQVHQSCDVPPCAGVCGNRTLDACEACDTGNTDGDCCLATCQFSPLGTPCTGGVCNAAGVCGPAPVTTSTATSTTTSSTVFGSTVSSTTSTSTSTTSSSTSTSSTTTSTSTTSTSTTTSTTLPPKCVGGTRKAAGATIKAKIACHAKAVKGDEVVDPSCLAKADQKFVTAFGKAGCPGTGAGVEVLVDACVAQLLLDVPGTDKCASASLKAIASAGGAILGCSAKGLKKPDKVTACLANADAKLSTKLTKAGSCANATAVHAHLALCLVAIQPEPR